jgi:ferredoxin
MSADKQSGPFSKPIAGGQNNSATIEALKEQIRIEVADCRGCGRCVEACPQEAIVLTAA